MAVSRGVQQRLHLRMRRAFERRLGPQAGAFLREQAKAVAKAYGVGGLQSVGVQLNADQLKLHNLLTTSYITVGDASADLRFKMLGVTNRFVNPHVVAFADHHAAERVVDISDNTARKIQAAVKGAVIDRLTTEETAREIQRALAGASTARAFAIARTEVGTAAAFGDEVAARESGLRLTRVWTTAGDDGKRHPSYPGLDGQERAMGEPFDVGGFEMDYPLDPNGPAEEVVNCRCALAYVPG